MCGIAGIFDVRGAPADQAVLERMNGRLVHRGPDGEGYHVAGPIGLAHRRLSVIDLVTGQQPMANEDASIWVSYNGEIYNFQKLREELICHGHEFRTASDTEVIVHAYEQYGGACVTRFRGMFAFALWDGRRQELFLARDRVGKKPLYYTRTGSQVVFASELEAMLQHPGILRKIDPGAIDDYLTYGYVPGPETGMQGIAKLLPGHHLTVRREEGEGEPQRLEPVRYWRITYVPKEALQEPEAVEGLIEVLEEATRLRLIADVPLGALLSGGVDSSLIVALMSRQSARPVQTFSVGFDEPDFNELSYARAVAQQYHTDHHELIIKPKAAEVLPALVRRYGEPFADSSALPSYYVARLTREHVTVALNGDGGDECFAGYERYWASGLADRYQRLPAWLRSGVAGTLARLVPDRLPRRSRWRQLKRFVEGASLPWGERYVSWMSLFSPRRKEALYTPEFRTRVGNREAWLNDPLASWGREALDPLDRLLAVDTESYLCYDLLAKMDIATMANSLEARSPFLDHKVMEFAARLPVSYKLRGRTLKYLLKKTGERFLPRKSLYRRKKGFAVPIGEWLRTDLRPLLEEVLLAPQAAIHELIEAAPLRALVEQHVQGRNDHAPQLWALLWLGLWRAEFSV